MTENRNPRRILINDDGWIMGEAEPPLRVRDLKERMVDTYAGAPVGALLWSIGGREVYQYETQVGEVTGEGHQGSKDPSLTKNAENVRSLIEECGGPMTAMVRLCHAAGIDLFPSVRMNSHYDIDPNAASAGRFRRDHAEVLIGRPGENIPEGSLEWGVRTGLDYSHPLVREHMAAVICELFERFDVNGVELDFMRHPTFFRLQDAYANRYLMTDLIRHVRRRMNEAAAAGDRNLDLAVRVPPTLADSARLGLDVKQWMTEGLVDIVIAGGGFIPFETPIDEFVRAAGGTDCLVYGCIENLRPAVDDDIVRAISSHFWDGGASGIYLFNYFSRPPEWKRRVLTEISDPAVLRRLNKRYQVDTTKFRADYPKPSSSRDLHDYAFQNSLPTVQLPVVISGTQTGTGPTIRLNIADDVDAAAEQGAPPRCVLTLKFENYQAEDEIEVRLNDEVLSSGSSKASFGGWSRLEWTGFPTRLAEVDHGGGTLQFSIVCPPLRRGDNELEVRLLRRTVDQTEHLLLADVELAIEYD